MSLTKIIKESSFKRTSNGMVLYRGVDIEEMNPTNEEYAVFDRDNIEIIKIQ